MKTIQILLSILIITSITLTYILWNKINNIEYSTSQKVAFIAKPTIEKLAKDFSENLKIEFQENNTEAKKSIENLTRKSIESISMLKTDIDNLTIKSAEIKTYITERNKEIEKVLLTLLDKYKSDDFANKIWTDAQKINDNLLKDRLYILAIEKAKNKEIFLKKYFNFCENEIDVIKKKNGVDIAIEYCLEKENIFNSIIFNFSVDDMIKCISFSKDFDRIREVLQREKDDNNERRIKDINEKFRQLQRKYEEYYSDKLITYKKELMILSEELSELNTNSAISLELLNDLEKEIQLTEKNFVKKLNENLKEYQRDCLHTIYTSRDKLNDAIKETPDNRNLIKEALRDLFKIDTSLLEPSILSIYQNERMRGWNNLTDVDKKELAKVEIETVKTKPEEVY